MPRQMASIAEHFRACKAKITTYSYDSQLSGNVQEFKFILKAQNTAIMFTSPPIKCLILFSVIPDKWCWTVCALDMSSQDNLAKKLNLSFDTHGGNVQYNIKIPIVASMEGILTQAYIAGAMFDQLNVTVRSLNGTGFFQI